MAAQDQFIIRAMTVDEVESIAVEWAAQEGWNPGLHDAPCFHGQDPDGFLVGLLDGEPVACVSAVIYDAEFAFLGFYMVKPELRGQGFGIRMGLTGLERVAGRNSGLDGVPAQQDSYRRSGFKVAYNNIRYQGQAQTGPGPDIASAIVPLAQVDQAALMAYDARVFPAPRAGFLRCWMSQPGSIALAAMDGAELTGYGVIRPCREGCKIGPLFADNPATAEALFRALAGSVEQGTAVFLDTPDANLAAIDLAKGHGMQPVFETARMYNQAPPDIDLARIFGVTSFELG